MKWKENTPDRLLVVDHSPILGVLLMLGGVAMTLGATLMALDGDDEIWPSIPVGILLALFGGLLAFSRILYRFERPGPTLQVERRTFGRVRSTDHHALSAEAEIVVRRFRRSTGQPGKTWQVALRDGRTVVPIGNVTSREAGAEKRAEILRAWLRGA